MAGFDHDGSGVHGLIRIVRSANAGRLRERKKVHGVVLPIDARVGGVFNHPDDLMRSVTSWVKGIVKSKSMPDGTAVAEELLDEFPVDDGDRGGVRRVLPREAAAHDHVRSDRIEVLRRRLHPGCGFVQVRIALNLYTRVPVVRLHGRVSRDADFENPGNAMEPVNDGLVKEFNFGGFVAGPLGINVGNIAVRCIQFHVHVLCLGEALCKEPRSNEQHEGERGLKDNESALEEGSSIGSCA